MNTRRNKRNNDTDARDNGSQKEKHTERKNTVTGKNACPIEEQEVEQEGTGYGGNECESKKQQVKERKNPQQKRKEFSDSEEDDVNTPIPPKTHKDKIESDTKRALTDKQNQRGIEWKVIIMIPILLYIAYNEIRLKGHDTMLKAVFDRTDLITLLDTLNEQVPSLASQMEHIKKDFSPFRIQFLEIQNHMKKINEQTTKLVPEVESLTEKTSKLQTDLLTEKENLEQLTVSVKDVFIQERQIKETLDTLEEPMRKFGDDFNSLARKHTDLDKKINNSISSTENITERLNAAKTKLSSLTGTIDKYENKIQNAEKGIAEAEQFQRELQELTSKTKETKELGRNAINTIIDLHVKIKNAESTLSGIVNSTDETIQKQYTLSDDINFSQQKITSLEKEVNNFESEIGSRIKKIDRHTSDMSSELERLNSDITEARKRNVDYVQKLDSVSGTVNTLGEAMKDVESMKEYTRDKLPNVDGRLRTLEEQSSTSWQFGINVFLLTVLCILSILIFFLYCRVTSVRLDYEPTQRTVSTSGGSETTHSRNHNQENILSKLQRSVTLETKICVLSFYKETQDLHLSLVKSLLETSGRGNAIEIIPFYVKMHNDVLNIPRCRYIFIFVDYNERNVILENEDQDLGDKKVVTVKASQKIGDKVFVIYVRDKGSKNLPQEHLYNHALSQFTSHPVLKDLESKKQCLSVYERFNTRQKEHIGRMIG